MRQVHTMTEFIYAHPSPYDVSITLAIFDNWEQVTRRVFPLRNLTGQTADEQIEEAASIMADVAGELHHMTGLGVDRGTVKLNGKKAYDVIYKDHAPHPQVRYFRCGVKFVFTTTLNYQWVNGRQHSLRKRLGEGWQRQIWEEYKPVSFRLPCLPAFNANERQEHFFYFSGVKKRGRKTIGWNCHFDREDAVYTRFIERFNDEGNLAVKSERYWRKPDSYVSVDGFDWPPPKFSTDRIPRRSKLASQPKDNTDYVYLIRMGRTNFYKIGKSNDPKGRLASMQTASPHKLKIVHVFKADNAAAAEESLHHRLHGVRQAGEWFKLTDEQQKMIASISAYEEGQFIIGGMKRSMGELFSE